MPRATSRAPCALPAGHGAVTVSCGSRFELPSLVDPKDGAGWFCFRRPGSGGPEAANEAGSASWLRCDRNEARSRPARGRDPDSRRRSHSKLPRWVYCLPALECRVKHSTFPCGQLVVVTWIEFSRSSGGVVLHAASPRWAADARRATAREQRVIERLDASCSTAHDRWQLPPPQGNCGNRQADTHGAGT